MIVEVYVETCQFLALVDKVNKVGKVGKVNKVDMVDMVDRVDRGNRGGTLPPDRTQPQKLCTANFSSGTFKILINRSSQLPLIDLSPFPGSWTHLRASRGLRSKK